jgi:putative ABC transport system permease protein
MLCLLAGLVAAVGLLSSIPLYAEAVHHRLLQGELHAPGEVGGMEGETRRPPFAFLWRYIGAWHGEIGWNERAAVDEYLTQQARGVIGLPLALQVRHAKTHNLRLFAAADSQTFADRDPLMWTSLGFISGLEDHIELLDGAPLSQPSPQAAGADVEVLISRALAEQTGLQVGERYVLFDKGDDGAQIPVARRRGMAAP